MKEVPSDVVELIIAVDLNPTDPSEPLNVSSVDVRDKGEGGGSKGGEDWKKLAMQLLMGDPKAGVTSDSISYDEAVEATARCLGDSEESETEKDPWGRSKPRREPQDEPDMPFHKGGRSDFGEKKPGGGMKMALNRALGRKDDEDEDEEDF